MKMKGFFAKLKDFSPKLKVSEIPLSINAGITVKKYACFKEDKSTFEDFVRTHLLYRLRRSCLLIGSVKRLDF